MLIRKIRHSVDGLNSRMEGIEGSVNLKKKNKTVEITQSEQQGENRPENNELTSGICGIITKVLKLEYWKERRKRILLKMYLKKW